MSTPTEDAAKGAAGAILDLSVKNIPELVRRFRDGQLAFIKDRESIDTVKQERDSAEWEVIRKFIPKEERVLGIQIQMGLALRVMEDRGQKGRIEDLRLKIFTRFGSQALHIAELAQRGILTEFLARLTKMYASPADVRSKFVSFLKQSEDLAIFVEGTDSVPAMVRMIKVRLDQIGAHTVLVFSRGFARSNANKIVKKLKEDKRGYVIETQDDGRQLTHFIFSPEVRARTAHWSESFASEEPRPGGAQASRRGSLV